MNYIIIPCFNEEKRISLSEYYNYLQLNPDISLCFVNDGSSDKTIILLKDIKAKYNTNVIILSLDKNSGKAEAVRYGVLFCCKNFEFEYIGYLDADLATPLFEFKILQSKLNNEIEFCFSSRILRIGSEIKRSNFRHFSGRVIASFISWYILKISVYDTQCGSKVFTKTLAKKLFNQPFISKWLFDVELFARIINIYGKENAIKKMYEEPILKWIDKEGSKVKLSYIFRLCYDLLAIKRNYKNQ